MDIALIIILMALGILFFILEIFFLPGISIGGVAGTVFTVGGIWYAFSQVGSLAGWITLGLGILAFVIAIYLFLKAKTLERLSLTSNVDSTAPTYNISAVAVGDKGLTISRLSPMGKVLVNGMEFEAKCYDNLLEPKTPIIITAIENQTLIVKETDY